MTEFLYGLLCGSMMIGVPLVVLIFVLLRAMPRYPG